MVVGGMLPTFDQELDDQFDLAPNALTCVDHNGRHKIADDQAHQINKHHLTGGRKQSLSHAQNPPNIIYLMSILSAMGGFLFGYDTGIVSGAMILVKKFFSLNTIWQEIVVSITILGAWIFSLVAGSLSEHYGRKTVILVASVVFTVGSIVMGVAWSKYILMFGRLTVGVAIGLSSTVVPMYIAEVAPANIRGSLVTLNNCFITFGQLSAAITAGAFSYDHENGWRWMLALAAIPASVQFLGFMFMPESPSWLIRRSRDDEALASLKRIRGAKNPYVVREFDRIRHNQMELMVQEERRKKMKRNIIVAILRKTATRRALVVGCLLQAVQQLAGINTVMYYTATIIEMSGVQSQSIAVWLAVPTAAVYAIFSFCGYLMADRLGRRTLTLGSLLGVIASLLILGTGFHLTSMSSAVVTAQNMSTLETCYSKRDCTSCVTESKCGFCYDAQDLAVATCLERDPDDNSRSLGGPCAGRDSRFAFSVHVCPSMTSGIGLNTWLVLTGLVMYLASFAPGMGPMPWTINSEIYPMWARSFCYSIATSVNWMFNMLISLTFISLTEVLTTHGAFYMYSIIASVGWLLLFWKLPETRGRSLDDISSLFTKSKPEDQEIIGEDANNSGGGVGQTNNLASGAVAFSQLGGLSKQAATGGGETRRHSAVCHDNLGFSGENVNLSQLQQQQQHQLQSMHLGSLAKSAPTDEPSILERNRSFKLDSPLSRAASLAMSQPDLYNNNNNNSQSSTAASNASNNCNNNNDQKQQVPPNPPPPPPTVVVVSGQQQQQHKHPSSYKRKYSDAGEQRR